DRAEASLFATRFHHQRDIPFVVARAQHHPHAPSPTGYPVRRRASPTSPARSITNGISRSSSREPNITRTLHHQRDIPFVRWDDRPSAPALAAAVTCALDVLHEAARRVAVADERGAEDVDLLADPLALELLAGEDEIVVRLLARGREADLVALLE